MSETAHERGQRLAREAAARGDVTGWFETLYATANRDAGAIQWADLHANPNLVGWLDREQGRGDGRRALVVGCGLGDDAEALARRGFDVVAFDVSRTAIDWCRDRFPASTVQYVVADVFDPPPAWQSAFDFILEAYTLQVLPADTRPEAMRHIAACAAPGATLLVICRGRDPGDAPGQMPWPLTRAEFDLFRGYGLREVRVEDYIEQDESQARRFRAEYRKDAN